MGKHTCKSQAQEAYAAGASLAGPLTFETGTVGGDVSFLLTGTGSADLEAPQQSYLALTGVTGAQTVDLSAVARPGGSTYNFGHVREITVQNLSTTPTNVITVGAAGSAPFLGPFGGTAPTLKVEAGETKTIACKPYGAGYSTSGAINLKLDFGANTFSAAVVIKGY